MPSNSTTKLRVVLTNDDGPPGPDSPYILGFYRHLTQDLGWDVKVVVPSTQKSWIGKAFQIQDTVRGRYYYPRVADDGQGEISQSSRSLKEGELGEWILLDATPASCSNIALHNLFPGEIDLVISGPNFGRNTSSVFSLSSGTIGAALSSSLSGTRSVALSYGTMIKPIPTTFHEPAFKLSTRIVNHLLSIWGSHGTGVLYSVNIPMIEKLLHDDGLRIYWTSVWKSNYKRLFKEVPREGGGGNPEPVAEGENLVFTFQPDLTGLLTQTSAPEGSDGWALDEGAVSVTPLLTSFAELPESKYGFSCLQDREWRFEL